MVAGIRQPLASVAREYPSFACCLIALVRYSKRFAFHETGYNTMNLSVVAGGMEE